MVYGGFRNGGGLYFGNQFRERARHGDENGHDLFADVPRLHLGLLCRGFRVAAHILQIQVHDNLFLPATAVGPAVLPYGGGLFPALEDDGRSREILRGVHHLTGVRVRRGGPSLPCDGSRHGGTHLALHPAGRSKNTGVDGFVSDILSFCGSPPYYI